MTHIDPWLVVAIALLVLGLGIGWVAGRLADDAEKRSEERRNRRWQR